MIGTSVRMDEPRRRKPQPHGSFVRAEREKREDGQCWSTRGPSYSISQSPSGPPRQRPLTQ